MTDDPGEECVAFLQWALPRLGLRWAGYRKVRRQVCRRVARRIAALGLPDHAAYRAHLEAHAEEWDVLRALTPVTISRFGRDRGLRRARRRRAPRARRPRPRGRPRPRARVERGLRVGRGGVHARADVGSP